MLINFNDFEKVDIRVGKIIEVNDYPEARKPAYKLKIDLGPEIGIKQSSAQLTQNHTKQELLNQSVLCVVNFPPKKIGPFTSEVLVLAVPDVHNQAMLISPIKPTPLGGKLY